MHDDEFEAIRKLMRLKRHETPGEGFTEDFLREFHRRQQEAAARQSGMDRFLQMLGDRFESFLNPKWGFAAAAAVIVLLAIFLNGFNNGAPASDQAAQIATQAPAKAQDPKKQASQDEESLENKPNGVAVPASHQKDSKKDGQEQ